MSNFVNEDIRSMSHIAISQYIQVDQRVKSWGDTQPNSYRIYRRNGKETKIILDKELNTGDIVSLKGFLAWIKSHSINLEQSLFIFWGHGEGWIGSCRDFLSQDRLDLHEMQAALEEHTFKAVGFDACIMASLEVMEVLSRNTSFFLASQEIEPKEGWHYGEVQPEADDFLTFFERMANSYINQSFEKPLCLSLICLEKVPKLIAKLNILFEQLDPIFDEFKVISDGMPRIANGEYVDLYTLLDQFEISLPQVSKHAASLKKTIEREIIIHNYTNDMHYRGISIWLPTSVRNYKIERYAKLSFSVSCKEYVKILRRYVE
ncbi:MAG: hypothetical protein GY710_04520 [Desulfobacteraceae bacterium]|nr:hypothetical protein [Desulfobacteraceae bacterium]